MGGVYNYIKSAQLPPGSTGITGDPDGTADGSLNAETFTIGTFQTNGWESVEGFVQPKFSGTVSYTLSGPGDSYIKPSPHIVQSLLVLLMVIMQVNTSCESNNDCLNKCSFPGSLDLLMLVLVRLSWSIWFIRISVWSVAYTYCIWSNWQF